MNEQNLPMLPPNAELETNAVLKQLAKTNRVLAELKGYADTIPNKHILINAIMINESKDSSAIENIITTHDDLYKAISNVSNANPAAKEVVNYRTALWQGYELVKAHKMITSNMIIEIQNIEKPQHIINLSCSRIYEFSCIPVVPPPEIIIAELFSRFSSVSFIPIFVEG